MFDVCKRLSRVDPFAVLFEIIFDGLAFADAVARPVISIDMAGSVGGLNNVRRSHLGERDLAGFYEDVVGRFRFRRKGKTRGPIRNNKRQAALIPIREIAAAGKLSGRVDPELRLAALSSRDMDDRVVKLVHARKIRIHVDPRANI